MHNNKVGIWLNLCVQLFCLYYYEGHPCKIAYFSVIQRRLSHLILSAVPTELFSYLGMIMFLENLAAQFCNTRMVKNGIMISFCINYPKHDLAGMIWNMSGFTYCWCIPGIDTPHLNKAMWWTCFLESNNLKDVQVRNHSIERRNAHALDLCFCCTYTQDHVVDMLLTKW